MQDLKILIVDDEKSIRSILKASLEDEGYSVLLAKEGVEGLRKIREHRPDVVLLDIWMPGSMDGIDVLTEAKKDQLNTEFIIMSGHGSVETAVRATKLGAWDFVEKPLSIEKILILLKNIASFQDERGEKTALLNRLRQSLSLVGESEPIMAVKQMISRVAPSNSWVLVTGENGTGKELIAQNIHFLSQRAGRPFVEVNCAAIPEDLIESELFGHEKGAFTGALKTRRGKFELANGGTVFLDEIGDMSLNTQAKVLRVLQEKRFERVGGEVSVDVDVRVIAATNKDLQEMIQNGSFREDLYHRLNIIPFKVPPLRERLDDIPILVTHFSQLFARESGYVEKVFSPQAIQSLRTYEWPGNVRELRNFIERIYILTPTEVVEEHDLGFAGLPVFNNNGGFQEMTTFKEARASFEKEFIMKKIEENRGNISRTAEKIGLERSYLHRKIKSYGLDV